MESLASTPAVDNAANTVADGSTEADAKVEKTGNEDSTSSAPKAGTSGTPEGFESWSEKAQKRYHELTREKYDALRERDQKDYELQRLQFQLQEKELLAKEKDQEPETLPTLEQFGWDNAKYEAAVAAHYAKLATEQGTKAAQEALQAERDRQAVEQSQKTWIQRESEFKKSNPKYEEIALKHPRDGGPMITNQMAEIIRASDQGPAIALYLGENVALSNTIAQLPPLLQAKEFGRIEAKLELAKVTPKPAVSQAPTPVPKVDSVDATQEKAPEDMIGASPTQFAKWRRKYSAKR